jgi:hypothetical protein
MGQVESTHESRKNATTVHPIYENIHEYLYTTSILLPTAKIKPMAAHTSAKLTCAPLTSAVQR